MFKNPYERGQFEFLPKRKKQQLILAIACLAVVFIFWGAGRVLFETSKNLLTIPAIFMALPAANFLVTFIAIAQYKPGSSSQYEALAAYDHEGMLLSNMILVNEKGKRQFVEFLVFYKGGVIGYASSITEEHRVEFETDVILKLKKKGLPMRLKLYSDWNEFMERIGQVEPVVSEEDQKKVMMAKDVVNHLSL